MSIPDISAWKLPSALLAGLAFLVLVFHYAFSVLGYRINLTPSVPIGLYREVPGSPARMDFVTYCLPISSKWTAIARDNGYVGSGDCPSGLRPVLKHLAGLPGDRIEDDRNVLSLFYVTPAGKEACLVNNIHIRSKDSQNRRLPLSSVHDDLDPHNVIPLGTGFLLGDSGDSFDSRYYGVVPLKALRKAVPIMQF